MEMLKTPSRTVVINYLLSLVEGKTSYLEIGVRNPNDNFNHVVADNKYSVDPGIEFEENPVDFQMTSDEFFEKLSGNAILPEGIKFNVIFIDGLHLADQVDQDIKNSIKHLEEGGFIVLHDCNPPTEWHARETYSYHKTPAGSYWNGTTWKAFLKWRFDPSVNSCCVDCDLGVGVLSKDRLIGSSIEPTNQFFEYSKFDKHRKKYLNLIDFDELKNWLSAK